MGTRVREKEMQTARDQRRSSPCGANRAPVDPVLNVGEMREVERHAHSFCPLVKLAPPYCQH